MLAQNLLLLRQERGMSQAALADKAELSLPAYRNLELGRSEPKLETVQRLAKALGVSLRELLAPQKPLHRVRFRALKAMTRRNQVLGNVTRWLRYFNELEELLD